MADATIGTVYLQVVPKLDQKTMTAQSVPAGRTAGDGIASGISAKSVAIGNILANVFMEAANKVGEIVSEVFVGAFENAAEYEQLIGGVEKLFGDAADTVSGYARKAYRTAGISANDYLRQATNFSASLLQSLGGDQQRAAEITNMAINDMADNASVFGSNIQDIQNAYQGFAKQNYTMLDNLKLGYGGTKTEMERLLEDAEKLSGIEYNIDSLSDVYEAIHVIQEEMEITENAANEAAGTVQGSMAQAHAAWENWLTAIGTGEGVQEATENLVDAIGKAIENVIPAIIQIFQSLGQLIVDGFTEAFPELAEAIGGFASSIQEAFGGIAERLAPLMEEIAPIAQGISDILYNTLVWVFDQLAYDVQAVSDAIKWVWDNVLVPFAEWCQETFGPIIEAVGGFFEKVGSTMSTSMDMASQAVIDSSSYMYGNLESSASKWQQQTDGTWKYVTGAMETSMDQAEASVGASTANIGSDMAFEGMTGKVEDEFNGAKQAMIESLSSAESFAGSTVEGILNSFSGLGGKITSVFGKINFPKAQISYRTIRMPGGNTIDIPDIQWMARGGFVDAPTLIGAGEAGVEMILPQQGALMDRFAEAITRRMGIRSNSVVVNLQYDAGEDASAIATDIANILGRKLAMEA